MRFQDPSTCRQNEVQQEICCEETSDFLVQQCKLLVKGTSHADAPILELDHGTSKGSYKVVCWFTTLPARLCTTTSTTRATSTSDLSGCRVSNRSPKIFVLSFWHSIISNVSVFYPWLEWLWMKRVQAPASVKIELWGASSCGTCWCCSWLSGLSPDFEIGWFTELAWFAYKFRRNCSCLCYCLGTLRMCLGLTVCWWKFEQCLRNTIYLFRKQKSEEWWYV